MKISKSMEFFYSVSQFQIAAAAAYLIINSDNGINCNFCVRINSKIRDEQIRNGWSYATNSDKLERYMSSITIRNRLTYFQKSSLTLNLNSVLSENKNANSEKD